MQEFLEFFSSERAYVIQQLAESEDNILRVLEQKGVSNTIVTMANEMQGFVTAFDIKDK